MNCGVLRDTGENSGLGGEGAGLAGGGGGVTRRGVYGESCGCTREQCKVRYAVQCMSKRPQALVGRVLEVR